MHGITYRSKPVILLNFFGISFYKNSDFDGFDINFLLNFLNKAILAFFTKINSQISKN